MAKSKKIHIKSNLFTTEKYHTSSPRRNLPSPAELTSWNLPWQNLGFQTLKGPSRFSRDQLTFKKKKKGLRLQLRFGRSFGSS